MSNRTIIIVLLIISVFGAGSIGLVWMRMEISAVAKECGELEDGRLKMPKAQSTFHVSKVDMERRLGNSSVAKRSQDYRTKGEFAGTQ